MKMDYLNFEDQFKKILNQEEISRIQNLELRKIRSKYWGLRHKVFINERNISDSESKKLWDELICEEQEELHRFKNKNTDIK